MATSTRHEVSTPAEGENPRALRVLCYGDSLTAGYCHGGYVMRPYAGAFEDALPGVVHSAIAIGLCGFTTTEMVESLDTAVCVDVTGRKAKGLRVALASQEFDVVVIMGGTNDLYDEVTAETIAGNLLQLHSVCHKAGASTIALGVPQHFMERGEHPLDEAARKKRRSVNEQLQRAATSTPSYGKDGGSASAAKVKPPATAKASASVGVASSGAGAGEGEGEGMASLPAAAHDDSSKWDSKRDDDAGAGCGEASCMVYVDTDEVFPYFGLSKPDVDNLWEGLHMSEEGYRVFGNRIASTVKPWLRSTVLAPS